MRHHLWIWAVLTATVVACLMTVPQVATGEIVVVDDFELPRPSAPWCIQGSQWRPTNTYLIKQQAEGIVGGERDMLFETSSRWHPASVSALIGAHPNIGRGMLRVATFGRNGASVQLQYDGIDTADSRELGLVNAENMLIDLTGGGTNNRFELDFGGSWGGGCRGLDIDILATTLSGGTLAYEGNIANSCRPFVHDIAFGDFTATGDASFDEINGITFTLNRDKTPKAAFALDEIRTAGNVEVVPEPSTLVLLGLGLVFLGICRWRGREQGIGDWSQS